MKSLKSLAMFAIVCVAVGTVTLTSCTKENEVINDVPAMETKDGELPRFLWTGCITLRWGDAHAVSPDSIVSKTVRCCEAKKGIICAVVLTPYGPGCTISRVDVSGGLIQKIILQTSSLSSDEYEDYCGLVENGTIIFHENCPIVDPEILAVVNEDYIPAGEYPITIENGEIIIAISK